jgi:phage N-6-adenine-methyltransferase
MAGGGDITIRPTGHVYVEHPLAALFPILEGEAYRSLMDDIREHGVREPVVMLDGKVLDGRNRYLAARECGADVPLIDFDGTDPLAFVVSLNLKRRHLAEGQRAMVAAKIANLPIGANQHSEGLPIGRASELLNVGERSIARAREVQERGTPSLIASVEAGEVSVSAAAEVARLDEVIQAEIVEEGPEAVREAAREIRETGIVNRTSFTGNNEWFTPPEHVERARRALGGIDLDPATHAQAQETVGATAFFTEEDDGLAQEWFGKVWLNPPYAQPAIGQFVDKLVSEFEADRVDQAIMLTHNYTDTAWFQKAAKACTAICFTRGRVRFVSPTGELAAPTQGQAFFYFGPHTEAFAAEFSEVGFVVEVRP